MKTSNQIRINQIAKKLDSANRAMKIARKGLSSANKKNPFFSKSDAMKNLNSLRNYQRQLSNIWLLEFSL